MKTTVIGSEGFIGRHIMNKLGQLQMEAYGPGRKEQNLFNDHLGHVIYCAGVTSDFRERPFDTIKAHVSFLAELLEKAKYESFLYVSSTRLYINQPSGKTTGEESEICVNPFREEDLFNLSKLTGESICLTINKPNVRVSRVSNVCGPDFNSNNFIYSIIKDSIIEGEILLRTSLESEKDYISINDVVDLLIKIAHSGTQRMYNVASGFNITNKQWVDRISYFTGCKVEVADNPQTIKFLEIDNERVRTEFNYKPQNPLDMLEELIRDYANGKR